MSAVLVSEQRLKTIVTRPICRLSTPNALRSAGMAGAITAASRAAMKTPTNSTVRMRFRAAASSGVSATVAESTEESGAITVIRQT